MKRGKTPELRNTILIDALAKFGMSPEEADLFLGVEKGTTKRWMNFRGLPPKKVSAAVAVRLRFLTGASPEIVVPAELFEMKRARPNQRELQVLSKRIIQMMVGASYLTEDPTVIIERREQRAAVIDALPSLSLEEHQLIQGFLDGTPDEELAVALKKTSEEISELRTKAIDKIRRNVHQYPLRLH